MAILRDLTPFGKRIKKKIIDLDITHKELASGVGITVQYLYDIMRGGRFAEKKKEEIEQYLEQLEKKADKQ